MRINEQSEILGERIRLLRKQQGWTQEELAYRAGMDASYLGQIERGRRRSPTLHMIEKIAAALSVDSNLLLEQSEAAATTDQKGIPWPNIPDKIAVELKQSSIHEQMMFYRILQVIRESGK